METTGKKKLVLMLWWSIVTAGAIGLFWTIWYLIVGEVPVVTGIKMTKNWAYILPFGISRWWDILIGPIWLAVISLLLTSDRLNKDKNLFGGVLEGLFGGLIIGLFFLFLGLTAGLDIGLCFGLAAGLFFGLSLGLVTGLGVGLAAALAAGLVSGLFFGLSLGLVTGLGIGLVVALVVALVASLGAVLAFSIRLVIKAKFWGKMFNRLLCK